MFVYEDNVETVRHDIRGIERDYLYRETLDFLHVNSFAGSGKTHITAEELAYSEQLFIYLCNKHDIGDEQKQKHLAFNDLLVIKSRQKLCKVEKFVDMAKYGISIKPFCQTCHKKDICEYYERIKEIFNEAQPWIGVHHHLGGLVNAYCNLFDVDVVVIDEYFLNAIYKNFYLDPQVLVQSYGEVFMSSTKSLEKDLILDILRIFQKMVKARERLIFSPRKFYNLLIQYIKKKQMFLLETLPSVDLIDFAETYEKTLAEIYFNSGAENMHHNIVTPIIYAIINIMLYWRQNGFKPTLTYIENVIKFSRYKKDHKTTRSVSISYFNLYALDLPCKVIILDATTPTQFYKQIFQRNIITLERNIALNTAFYQISTGKYVMTTLDSTTNNIKNRLKKMVKNIARKHKDEQILVVSRAKYEEELQKLRKNIVTDHYPLVGSNEYDKINVCVVFGTPEPRKDILKRKSILLNCDVEDLLYIERETNILQAIHRIRLSIKHDIMTYVYLLTNVKLPISNIRRFTFDKLEMLLDSEFRRNKTIENEEDNIRAKIYECLRLGPKKLSQIVNKTKVNNSIFLKEILDRMIEDDLIVVLRPERKSRGRPPTFFMLAEHYDE